MEIGALSILVGRVVRVEFIPDGDELKVIIGRVTGMAEGIFHLEDATLRVGRRSERLGVHLLGLSDPEILTLSATN